MSELNNFSASVEGMQEAAVFEDGIVTNGQAIPVPTPGYLAATTKIDISNLPSGSLHDFITDNGITVTFSTPMQKLGPVPDGWATWSSPPFSESANPDVLYTVDQNSLTMELSDSARIFGFELEPFFFGVSTYTADFYSGDPLVDSITRDVNGNAGARLFGRVGEPINRVVVSGPDTFAIAQIRLQTALEQIQKVMLIISLLLLLLVIPPFLL